MNRRLVSTFGIFACMIVLAAFFGGGVAGEARAATPVRTDALVLVNSQSDAFADFAKFVQPYLENFGVPYSVLDVSTAEVPATVGQYSLVIVGHRRLDVGALYIDASEQDLLASAVAAGSGLVTFDNDLWNNAGFPRYSFVQTVFAFTRGGGTSGTGVAFPAVSTHYISERHATDEVITTGTMRLAGITLTAPAAAVAVSGDQPLVAVTDYGSGRAVQWGSYDWMSHGVLGPVHGLDDLVWRSLAWAARKPFVMQALPSIVTMRVDDVNGPFDYVPAANDFGLKPWLGVFMDEISSTEAQELSTLANGGKASVSIHSFTNTRTFYFDITTHADYPDSTWAANFALGTQWHRTANIPISSFLLTHFYDFGTNVFGGLQDWGVEFVGTLTPPGVEYGQDWAPGGPYRLSETLKSNVKLPVYYADFLAIPGHPELDGTFFNCMTEIRDDVGTEWYPTNDVPATVGRGVRQLRRALDSRVLSTLFAHEPGINGITAANWRSILQGVTAGIADYQPVSMTMDEACRYVRAISTSGVSIGTYDPVSQAATTVLSGSTDTVTRFSLFTGSGDQVEEQAVTVPAFSGSIQIVTALGSVPGDLTPPVISGVAVSSITDSAATVTWSTDEDATSQVEYGTSAAYDATTSLDTSMSREHAQALAGLQPNTVYHYRVLSRDAAGNLAWSQDGTFTTDTALPALSVDDFSIAEGDAAGVSATFTVSLSSAAGEPVSVGYQTADGSALAGIDYAGAAGYLSFAPGETSRTVTVAILGDLLDEADETFALELSSVAGATIGDGRGICTISDDDLPPALSIDDVQVVEGDSGTVSAAFTVSLSAASGLPVTVSYATDKAPTGKRSKSAASPGKDYKSTSGTLTFSPGVRTQMITVTVVGDRVAEPNEVFLVGLSEPVNAVLARSRATGTIVNDD